MLLKVIASSFHGNQSFPQTWNMKDAHLKDFCLSRFWQVNLHTFQRHLHIRFCRPFSFSYTYWVSFQRISGFKNIPTTACSSRKCSSVAHSSARFHQNKVGGEALEEPPQRPPHRQQLPGRPWGRDLGKLMSIIAGCTGVDERTICRTLTLTVMTLGRLGPTPKSCTCHSS